MSKLPKDGRSTVRYNLELFEQKLKKKGWKIQTLLDWALEEQSGVQIMKESDRKKIFKLK